MNEWKNGPHIGAAYIRVSSEDQLEYSPDSQLKLIREYAKREGYLIPDDLVYQDDGISGRSADKRPAFRLMIAMAKEENRSFDCIFVWKYSRFARNQEEAIMYKNLLKKKGIMVKSISEPASDRPFSSLIERIIEWMDEYYLINLSGEVRRGMKEKATRGEAMGRPPFGYKVVDKVLVPDENADVVRYIFSQFVSGVGYITLAHDLQDKGVMTSKGTLPTTEMVQYILRNPAYIGKTLWSENGRRKRRLSLWDVDADTVVYVDGRHEPLIDMDTWNTVQEKLRQRSCEMKYKRAGGHVNLLKGLLRCGDCGSTLMTACRNGLQCRGYTHGVCRVSHYINRDKAEKAVIALLNEIVKSDSYVFSPTAAPAPPIQRDWDKLIAAEELKLARARDAYLSGVFQMEEYISVKSGIEASIAKLEQQRDRERNDGDHEVKIDIAAYHNKVMEVLRVVEDESVSNQAKNEALRSILEKIVFNKPQGNFDFYFVP
ncbi:MAG: recombinase family protein [Oscillibacter sp.]|nr:recombinase family protein [Oscillibacter sp.]